MPDQIRPDQAMLDETPTAAGAAPARRAKEEVEILRGRFARFLSVVLEPAVHGSPIALETSAWQTDRRFAIDAAREADYTPVRPGFRWGPKWSTCWFRLRGTMPGDDTAGPIDLRFSTRTEATIWLGGQPVRGLDINRETFELSGREGFGPGESFEILIEAACNHPFGVVTFDWDTPDTHDRWRSDQPGHLLRADLAPRREQVRRLVGTYRFASTLLAELDPGSADARRLYDALASATVTINDRDVPGTADAAHGLLLEALRDAAPEPARPVGLAVGHAHIDTAWLWPIAETRRKVVRSWTNALEVIERVPGAAFICSQAQQYAWLEADAPAVFERVRERVADGRFEPMGGMWVEPDVGVPSAESLVRQVLHGERYWREKFGGERGAQTMLYLPDTFGFPASLPNIMLACGLDTFITNKMSWNQSTPYEHTNFRWKGLGGATVLAHYTPNHDYNTTNSAKELVRTRDNLRGHPAGSERHAVFLHPYGFGDGGGGPTLEQAETIDRGASLVGLPELRHGTAAEFRRLLHDLDASLPAGLPTHDGELYLELHRGTLTTHAWLKQSNRACEQALRLAEVACFAAPAMPDAESASSAAAELENAWRCLCLQQFHDILPGSSITPVYHEARRDIIEIREAADRVSSAGLRGWVRPSETDLAVFNPASSTRTAVVETGGDLRYVQGLPAVGIAPLQHVEPAHAVELNPDTGTLRNGLIEARIDRFGRVALLKTAGGPDLAEHAPLNRLALYRDIPMNWDAWDIDAYTETERLWTNEDPPETWNVKTRHPLRAEIEVVRRVGDGSRITQTFRLDAGSPRLDIITDYDWNETHRLLRAEMPTDLAAAHATYEIQGGFVTRPTSRNTPSERMMFEVCAHRWMDLAEAEAEGDAGVGRGLAILNDGRFGHGCHGGLMHLSLLRAPTHPDPTAGRDTGRITYSLMPHGGDWRAADVDLEAEALNAPLRVLSGTVQEPWSPVTITAADGQHLEISAIKPAHDDPRAVVLRLLETRGVAGAASVRWNMPITSVHRSDAIERPLVLPLRHEAGETTIDVRPHEIITLIAERGG